MTDTETRLILILEECLDAIEQEGRTVEACLARYPADRDRLEPLLTAAVRVRFTAENIHPSQEFQRDSTRRLKARLPARRGNGDGRWRRIAAMAASIALLVTGGGGAGLVYASDSAVPGDALYGVDQRVEQAQVQWASESHAVTLQADFLDERLSEAEQLADEGDLEHLNEALNNYDMAANTLADALFNSGLNEGEVLAQVDEALSNHEVRLQEVLEKVPEQARPGILRAIEASQNGREHAQQALENHGKPENTPGNGPPENPGSNGQGHGKGQDDDGPGQGQGQSQNNGNGPPDHAGQGNKPDKDDGADD